MAKTRRFQAFDDLTSDDDDQKPMALLGAAFDLGLQPRQQQQPRTGYQEPVSNSPSYQSRAGASSPGGNGMSQAEQFDTDRINSLDNTLSAAQRTQGFMRYRAKYGAVASFGGR